MSSSSVVVGSTTLATPRLGILYWVGSSTKSSRFRVIACLRPLRGSNRDRHVVPSVPRVQQPIHVVRVASRKEDDEAPGDRGVHCLDHLGDAARGSESTGAEQGRHG